MPWKAFMQSSALTNSGNQLANELFMQRENTSCSLNIAPKWGDSLFELFCCHLETHFEVIQEMSVSIHISVLSVREEERQRIVEVFRHRSELMPCAVLFMESEVG